MTSIETRLKRLEKRIMSNQTDIQQKQTTEDLQDRIKAMTPEQVKARYDELVHADRSTEVSELTAKYDGVTLARMYRELVTGSTISRE